MYSVGNNNDFVIFNLHPGDVIKYLNLYNKQSFAFVFAWLKRLVEHTVVSIIVKTMNQSDLVLFLNLRK